MLHVFPGWKVCSILALAVVALGQTASAAEPPPNIVLIYVDDLGYGDVGCYGATRVRTPNIDKLAAAGLRFTDAHSSSSTCTPSRYALMTGEYPWRKKGTGILPGDAALIIEPGRTTLPSLLKSAGYTTGVVGKWHLGLGKKPIDWNGEIKPGPLEIGFDEAFIIPATGDRVPCVYVENHRVFGLDPQDPITVSYREKVGTDPTGKEHPELLKMRLHQGHDQTIVNGISRIGYMSGGKSARWVDEEMADVLTRRAITFLEHPHDKPFFLYFATHDIHVPRVPHSRFAGKSQSGVRGDVIEELDWCVGEVLATLDRLKLTDNTLVIFTSDNGPVVDDGYGDRAAFELNGHQPAGRLRGRKGGPYEGGTRIPMIARWPGHIPQGQSDALVCQIDFLASFASLLNQKLSADAGPDSENVLPAFLGKSAKGRTVLVEQGMPLCVRQGEWKWIPRVPRGKRAKAAARAAAVKPGATPMGELYNLHDDIGEYRDVSAEHPEKVRELSELLAKIRKEAD